MRVLRVIGGIDPAFGGPAVSAANSCVASQRTGVDNTFVFPTDRPVLEEARPGIQWMKGEGIEVRTWARLRGRWAARWGISLGLPLWLARNARRFDVVH